MNIYLLGYMGSGKSTLGKLLASKINCEFLDFDSFITEKEGMSISEIFQQKGEIYFRKKEMIYLQELVQESSDSTKVIALGGGTPCYGNSMEVLNASNGITVYLNVSFKALSERLWKEKTERPLVASKSSYDELEDFVRKHLFERSYFYNQAQLKIKTAPGQTAQELVEDIIVQLF